MIESTYIITRDLKTPFVLQTNQPHIPQVIKYKNFKAGQIIKGKMQVKNGQPAFVLVANRLVIPISAIREVFTKEVVSGADGKTEKPAIKKIEDSVKSGKASIKYMDALLVGAVIGIAGTYLAEKKQWIPIPSTQNKLYGAAIGGALMAYIVYRIRNK